MYAPLSRYADWLMLARDAEESGMIDIVSPREIGERHSSRFEGVDPGGARDELRAGRASRASTSRRTRTRSCARSRRWRSARAIRPMRAAGA